MCDIEVSLRRWMMCRNGNRSFKYAQAQQFSDNASLIDVARFRRPTLCRLHSSGTQLVADFRDSFSGAPNLFISRAAAIQCLVLVPAKGVYARVYQLPTERDVFACFLACRGCQILDALQRDYRQAKLVRHGATFSVLAVGGGLSGGSVFLGAPVEMAVGAAAMALLSAGGLQVTKTRESQHAWLCLMRKKRSA